MDSYLKSILVNFVLVIIFLNLSNGFLQKIVTIKSVNKHIIGRNSNKNNNNIWVLSEGKGMNDKINRKLGSVNELNEQLSSMRTKSKMGPPQRKLNTKAESLATGRVSVYCVGSGIDLDKLRAHVFRRGFGNDKQKWNRDDESNSSPELILTRKAEDTEIDDEVLHVSNAPVFITSMDDRRKTIKKSAEDNNNDNTLLTYEFSDNNSQFSKSSSSSLQPQEEQEDSDDYDLKTKELLAMSTQDIFYFEYGCVVFWGLTAREEKAAMTELAPFTIDPVKPVELEKSFDTMEFVFDKTANPQRPIRFDRMRLRSLQVEEKLALSYAMAQSSKLFVFELRVFDSLEVTRYLPKELASKGQITLSKKKLNQLIGELFVEQTEVNLFSSILDTPDFLWEDDEFVPAYQYSRSYLEVDARVALLNSRLSVIRELLDVLTAQVANSNSTRLEWIIIWLISIEIIMGVAASPLFSGKKILTAFLGFLFFISLFVFTTSLALNIITILLLLLLLLLLLFLVPAALLVYRKIDKSI